MIKNTKSKNVIFLKILFNNIHIGNVRLFIERKKISIAIILGDIKYHGKGIGKSLLQEVVQGARLGVQEAVVLNVNKFNRKAIDFYLRMDFTIAQEEVIDIGNGYVMDDYVMRKDFSTP